MAKLPPSFLKNVKKKKAAAKGKGRARPKGNPFAKKAKGGY